MLRSPQKSVRSKDQINYPSAKLASVTRKHNDIKRYFSKYSSENLNEVKESLCDFDLRVQKWETAHKEHVVYLSSVGVSDEEIKKVDLKYSQNFEEQEKFKISVHEYIKECELQITVDPDDSASGISKNSKYSKVSRKSKESRVSEKSRTSISSLRIKMAQEKAKLKTDQMMQEQEKIVENENKRLDMKRRELMIKNMENELEDLDNNSERNSALHSGISKKEFSHLSTTNQRKVKSVVKSETSSKDIITQLCKTQDRASLPKNEPDIFDGRDITKYASFMQSFRFLIESKCDHDGERFYYLSKYTRDEPHDLVESCRCETESVSYKKALDVLEKTYGNEILVAQSLLKKLDTWPIIKNEDAKALRELALFLTKCVNMIPNNKKLSLLDNPGEIKKITEKVPFKLRDRWRAEVIRKEEKNEECMFRHLAEFIQKQSNQWNHPLYGHILEDKKVAIKTSNKKFTFMTDKQPSNCNERNSKNYTEQTKYCVACKKDNHYIKDCYFFKKRSFTDKIEYIKEKKLCYICLMSGHIANLCRSKPECQKCKKRHFTFMHNDEYKFRERQYTNSKTNSGETSQTEAQQEEAGTENPLSTNSNVYVSQHSKEGEKVLCPAVPVRIKLEGNNNTIETYAGLDSFSTDTYMSQSLLKDLGAWENCKEINLLLSTMIGEQTNVRAKVINNLEIFDIEGNYIEQIPVVYCKNNWPFNKTHSPCLKDIQGQAHLVDVPIHFIDKEIGLLIGAKQSDLMKPHELISGPPSSPFALKYSLGWALTGVSRDNENFTISNCHFIRLEDKIDIMYNQEFKDENGFETQPSIDDIEWENIVKNSINKLPSGHYETDLPFKINSSPLPNNKKQVEGRLNTLKRKLKTNPEFHNEYQEFMNMMIEAGYAEKIPVKELRKNTGEVWYLTHFAVYHKVKKKLRIVFDCSLKYNGVSLNDKLYQGPDLTNSLLGVLLRFRQHDVAFMADIKKMFYQIKVVKPHQDFLRFLWFPNDSLDCEPHEYRVTVHIFGAKSSPSCANYILKHITLTEAANKYLSETLKTINNNFYVDDLLKSLNTVEYSKQILKEIINLLSVNGFKLTAFLSNSNELLKSLPPEEVSKTAYDADLMEDASTERALGVTWNVQTDELGYTINLPNHLPTKRGILSTVFSIYDPFGFVSPALLPAKRIFQKACHIKLGWDEKLPEDLLKSWELWLREAPSLSRFKVARSIQKEVDTVHNAQLHIFCDGSETAYGAVAYMRLELNNNEFSSEIILSKSHLVPMNKSITTTIPRIELNAAKLGVKLYIILKKELETPINEIFFWTDSQTVLKYLNNTDKRFQRFVTNRVAFINAHTENSQWKYVPSKMNPADLNSRGTTVTKFIEDEMWKTGPGFLTKAQDQWPNLHPLPVTEDDPEIRKEKLILTTSVVQNTPTQKLIESSSTLNKTLLKLAWIMRIKEYLRKKTVLPPVISVNEIKRAEVVLYQYIQREEFPETYDMLRKGKTIKKNDKLKKLRPHIGEADLIRVGGRIQESEEPYEAKHPIILPKKHHIVTLLIEDAHKKVGHLGKSTTLAYLRNRYWIVKGNSAVKRVLKDCLICRKIHGKPRVPLMASLPKDRVTGNIPPFTNIGIDCFGPFIVSRGRSKVKRYGIIFTCLASRAIHIEELYSLTTDSFIQALIRFRCRRGNVTMIRSDRGTNFLGGSKELRGEIVEWNNKYCETWLRQEHIRWEFNPPASSHFGGVWEREIKTIRQVLTSLMKEQLVHLDDEQLLTLFNEVENVLNSRPLCELSDDCNDPEPLTPNHLLLLRSDMVFPIAISKKEDMYLKKRWKQGHYLADLFWKRWRREYLPLLQKRQKWNEDLPPHQVGDLVLLMESEFLPRNQWSLGRIKEVHPDKHGIVRVVTVKLAKIKGKGPTVLTRPVAKLILLRTCAELER